MHPPLGIFGTGTTMADLAAAGKQSDSKDFFMNVWTEVR